MTDEAADQLKLLIDLINDIVDQTEHIMLVVVNNRLYVRHRIVKIVEDDL